MLPNVNDLSADQDVMDRCYKNMIEVKGVHWFWWLFWLFVFTPALLLVAFRHYWKKRRATQFNEQIYYAEYTGKDFVHPTPYMPTWVVFLAFYVMYKLVRHVALGIPFDGIFGIMF